MQNWEHCELVGKQITYLTKGLFNKDSKSTEKGAWKELTDGGWELVSVVADAEGVFHYFFKRPVAPEK